MENQDIENKKQKSKQYNAEYYSKNKAKITSDLCKPCVCQFCGRTVIKNNLQSHYKTKICEKKLKFNMLMNKRKEQFEIICNNEITNL